MITHRGRCGGACLRSSSELEQRVVDALTRGVPPEAWMTNLSEHAFELIYNDVKYSLRVTMGSHTLFYIHVNGEPVCEAEVLVLQDGGLKVLLGGKAHTVHTEETKVGLKVHVDGHPCFFPDDFDPTKMIAPGTGKLLRYLPRPAAWKELRREIEVMKTVMLLLATSTGTITQLVQPGAAWNPETRCATWRWRILRRQGEPAVRGRVHQDRATADPPRMAPCSRLNSTGIIQLLAGYDFNKTEDPVTPLLEVSARCASPWMISPRPSRLSPRAPARWRSRNWPPSRTL